MFKFKNSASQNHQTRNTTSGPAEGFFGMGNFSFSLIVSVVLTLLIWAVFEYIKNHGPVDLVVLEIFNTNFQEVSAALSVIIGLPIAFAGAYAVIKIAQATHTLGVDSHKLSEEARDHDYFMMLSERCDKLGNCYTKIMPEINNYLQQLSNFRAWLTMPSDYGPSGYDLYSDYLKSDEYDEEKNKEIKNQTSDNSSNTYAHKALVEHLSKIKESFIDLHNALLNMDDKYVVDFLIRSSYGENRINELSFYKFITHLKSMKLDYNDIEYKKTNIILSRLCISTYCKEEYKDVDKVIPDSYVPGGDSYTENVGFLNIGLYDLLNLIEVLMMSTSYDIQEYQLLPSVNEDPEYPLTIWEEHFADGETGKPSWFPHEPDDPNSLLEFTKYILMIIPNPTMIMLFLREQLPERVYKQYENDLPHFTEMYNFRSGLPEDLLLLLEESPATLS